MISDINVAIVGAGFIGPVHAEALKRVGVNVVGILGCDQAESDRAREKLNLPRAFASYEEILSDKTIHAVHLCVPNVLHYPMSKQAIAAGKHVMCEKPLAMNATETAELVELTRSKKLAAGVCYLNRFYPLVIEARERIAGGEAGKVFAVNGSYVQDWLLYDTDYNWRVLASEGGELRAVSDIGTHWMDLVTHVTGLKIEAVFADLATFHKTRKRPLGEVETFSGKGKKTEQHTESVEITTDDYGTILLRFVGGARGSVTVSQVTAGRKNCNRFEISAANCSLAWNSERPEELWIGHRDSANELMLRDPALMHPAAAAHTSFPGGHCEGHPDAFRELFRSFYGYIDAGDFSAEAPYPTFEAGHHEVELCEAILTSHREQRWVTL